MSDAKPTIVVRRKKVIKGHGHSSAWKIAFADFATAMMAFFLVLWLTESTSVEEQKAISGYFTDPVGFQAGGQQFVIDLLGRGESSESEQKGLETATAQEAKKVLNAETVEAMAQEIEQRKFEILAQKIRDMITTNQALEPYQDQVQLSVTPEGLQIQIMDQDQRPMFDKGSDVIKPHARAILEALGSTIAELPNRISLSGHTDASGYTARENYSNWELSSERANAARRALIASGVREDQVTRVIGMGSSNLYVPDEPLNPINRRISILVLSKQREEDLEASFRRATAPDGLELVPVQDKASPPPANDLPAALPDKATLNTVNDQATDAVPKLLRDDFVKTRPEHAAPISGDTALPHSRGEAQEDNPSPSSQGTPPSVKYPPTEKTPWWEQ